MADILDHCHLTNRAFIRVLLVQHYLLTSADNAAQYMSQNTWLNVLKCIPSYLLRWAKTGQLCIFILILHFYICLSNLPALTEIWMRFAQAKFHLVLINLNISCCQVHRPHITALSTIIFCSWIISIASWYFNWKHSSDQLFLQYFEETSLCLRNGGELLF